MPGVSRAACRSRTSFCGAWSRFLRHGLQARGWPDKPGHDRRPCFRCNSIRIFARYNRGMAHDHDNHYHAHGHAHDHAGHSHAPDSFGAAFAIGAALNTAFVIAELIFGYAANSLALISDAVHNLSDVVALLLAWGAAWLALRKPTERHTYGYRRGPRFPGLVDIRPCVWGGGAP